MIRILFVCHGNICRSPMAEYVMKKLVKDAGLEDAFEIASAATSREEIGNPVYPPARVELAKHGISCKGHAARQMTRADYDLQHPQHAAHLRRPGGQDAAAAVLRGLRCRHRRPLVHRPLRRGV